MSAFLTSFDLQQIGSYLDTETLSHLLRCSTSTRQLIDPQMCDRYLDAVECHDVRFDLNRIVTILKTHNRHSLNLRGNEIGQEGAPALAEVLKVNTSLQSLNLQAVNKYIRIGQAGAQALAEALKVNTSLQSLNLECNEIDQVGAQALAQALTVNTSLRRLNLRNNAIGDAGAQALEPLIRLGRVIR